MADITAIILTKNEELNIANCINSIKNVVKRIVVIDSFSDDRTREIASSLGAEVYKHEFINHSSQFYYGVKKADVKTKWIFRIDADERLTKESAAELEVLCNQNGDTDVNGIIVRFKVRFMEKDLLHGGVYPFRKLLVYKAGKGAIENRNMDEHIILFEGQSIEMKSDSLHYDYKDLTYWINKHNWYSSRETQDYFASVNSKIEIGNLDKKARIKRFIKFNFYYKLPMGLRAWIYYVYRYYIKCGFLDGKEGKIYAVLQAYWYRFLVDAKIYECQKTGKYYEKTGDLK